MPFSESAKDTIYYRSGGQCQCTRLHTSHWGFRCTTTFTRYSGQWHAHHRTAVAAGGGDEPSNGEALCLPCHFLTHTYGG